MDAQDTERTLSAVVAEQLPDLPDRRCILAASGGADSTAMVALLIETGAVRSDNVTVGHFDHRLRGDAASQRDRAALAALCARYGLHLAIEEWDAPRAGEAAARDARYGALARIATQQRAGTVVTGHTADDQAETVVMHAMRGAGLHGLAGMAPDAPHPSAPGLRIVRPLLAITREETRGYCAARGLAYHDDASNDDHARTRNRIRHEILPAMTRNAPNMRDTLVDLARTARAAAAALDDAAVQLVPCANEHNAIAMPRAALRAAPPELVPHAFRLALARLLGDARDFERRHYALLARAVAAATGSTLMLPRGVVLTVDADALRLSRGPLAPPELDTARTAALPFEGIVGGWSVRILAAADALLADGGIDIRLPEGAVVRARRPGDRVRTRAGGKKLGDWCTDRKIPQRERDAAPVIAYGQHVFWTPWAPLGELPHGRPWRIISHRREHESAPAAECAAPA
jgi:tRNA(Ile)-lysidine synthase